VGFGSAKVNNTRRQAQERYQINPSLEATVTLVSPAIQAGFYMPENRGWKHKKRVKREIDPETLPTVDDFLNGDA
jgi:hypothetical protein